MLEDHPLFTAPVPVPAELAARARERGWDDDAVQRAVDLRVPRADLEFWLTAPHMGGAEVSRILDNLDRVFCGPLRTREATWRDHEALVDLYADAPEDIGSWELVVERGPNPFAQFRLQEHVNMQVVECRGVLLAATAHSTRNTLIAGERTTAHLMSAWRVRGDFRGMGLSRLLQGSAGPMSAWFGMATYWYERSDNASQGWLDKIRAEAESRSNPVSALTATVHLYEPRSPAPLEPGLRVRAIEPADVPCCTELINATHAGLDLFRPYSPEFLESRLDDPSWGPKPQFWSPVYGWEDTAVVEDRNTGAIVACGGLWDKGRDVREVWTDRASGAREVFAPTALLDWGHAPGREDAMAALVREFLGRSAELGRTHLVAPLEHAPGVRGALAGLPHRTETRALRSMGYQDPTVRFDPVIERPYTDLAYW